MDADFNGCTFDISAVSTTDAYPDGLQAVGSTFEVTDCTNVAGTMEEICSTANGGTINIH